MVKDVDDIEGFGPLASPTPKRGGKKETKPPSGVSQKSLATEIAAVLIQANLILTPVLRGDAMDDVEIMALAKAMDEQAKKSPRFRKALMKALEATGGAGLLTVVGMILGRRASRHGYVPRDWDEKMGAYLAFTQMTPSQAMEYMNTVVGEAMAEAMQKQMAEAASGNNDSDTEPAPESGPVPTEASRPN